MSSPVSVILDFPVEQGLLSADQAPSLREESAAPKASLERLLQMGTRKPQPATRFRELGERTARSSREESAAELARNIVEERPLLEGEDSAPRPAVLGRYDLLNALGKGGGGAVYRALDRRLDRVVAVKRVHFGDQPRFLREAKTTARLQHPHIIPIFDVGSDAEACYLVLQYVEGHTLPDWIRATRPDFAEVARALQEASEAIAFAHEHRVLHRDLKPDNLLVDSTGKTFVGDFGIALQTDASVRLTRTGTVLGTPLYMSPEQTEGKPERLTELSDVYSLGATLYHALTGRPPFHGGTLGQVLHDVLHTDPPRPRSLNPAIPSDLETICLKAMEKEPARRYRTARDLAEDLARFRTGGPIAARPPGASYRLRKFMRRKRWGIVSIASALPLALVTGAMLWKVFRAQSFEEARTQARISYEGREWRKALIFCEQALRLRDDEALLRMRDDCRTRTAAEEAFRRLRERIVRIQEKIAVTESQFYVRDIDIVPKLSALEGELEGLARIVEEPMHRDHAEGWRTLGYGWYVVGDRERSARALQKAVELSPADPRANPYLARLYLEFSLESKTEREFRPAEEIHAEARRWAQEALRRIEAAGAGGGADPVALAVTQAHRALAQNEEKEVFRICDEALKKFGNRPGTEEFWSLIGWIRRGEKGIEACDKALDRRPHYAWGHFIRGHLRLVQQDSRGAEEDFAAVLRLNPRILPALTFRGRALWMQGKYDESIRDFTEAIRRDGKYALAYHFRGDAKSGKEDLDGAIADFSRAIRYSPRLLEAYKTRGNLRGAKANRLHEKGRVPEAIEEWEEVIADCLQVIRLDPRTAAHYYNCGVARDSKGWLLWGLDRNSEALAEWKSALEDYTAALRLDRANADAWNNRGAVRIALEDSEGAIADCSKALSLRPDHSWARFNRGRAYLRKGDRGNAKKDLMALLKVAPADWPDRREAEDLLKNLSEERRP